MIIKHNEIPVNTDSRPTFHDVTEQVQQLVADSAVQNGIVTVFSQHTSCSVFIQEDSEDVTYWNVPLILQDMLNVFDKIIPPCEYEGQYLHPGPIHIERAMRLRNEEKAWGLNTDGHIRSCLLGRSETIPVVNGKMTLGEFGRIYFADFDRVRGRNRVVRVQILGE